MAKTELDMAVGIPCSTVNQGPHGASTRLLFLLASRASIQTGGERVWICVCVCAWLGLRGPAGGKKYGSSPGPATILGSDQWAWLEKVIQKPADLKYRDVQHSGRLDRARMGALGHHAP